MIDTDEDMVAVTGGAVAGGAVAGGSGAIGAGAIVGAGRDGVRRAPWNGLRLRAMGRS